MKYFTFLLITLPFIARAQDKPDLLTMLEKDSVKLQYLDWLNRPDMPTFTLNLSA